MDTYLRFDGLWRRICLLWQRVARQQRLSYLMAILAMSHRAALVEMVLGGIVILGILWVPLSRALGKSALVGFFVSDVDGRV